MVTVPVVGRARTPPVLFKINVPVLTVVAPVNKLAEEPLKVSVLVLFLVRVPAADVPSTPEKLVL